MEDCKRGHFSRNRQFLFSCFFLFSERTREPVDIDTQTLLNSPTQKLENFFFRASRKPKMGKGRPRIQGEEKKRKGIISVCMAASKDRAILEIGINLTWFVCRIQFPSESDAENKSDHFIFGFFLFFLFFLFWFLLSLFSMIKRKWRLYVKEFQRHKKRQRCNARVFFLLLLSLLVFAC